MQRAITRDNLIQEARPTLPEPSVMSLSGELNDPTLLEPSVMSLSGELNAHTLLEPSVMSLSGELNSPSKAYAIARKTMQRAIIACIRPVTHSSITLFQPSLSLRAAFDKRSTNKDPQTTPEQ